MPEVEEIREEIAKSDKVPAVDLFSTRIASITSASSQPGSPVQHQVVVNEVRNQPYCRDNQGKEDAWDGQLPGTGARVYEAHLHQVAKWEQNALVGQKRGATVDVSSVQQGEHNNSIPAMLENIEEIGILEEWKHSALTLKENCDEDGVEEQPRQSLMSSLHLPELGSGESLGSSVSSTTGQSTAIPGIYAHQGPGEDDISSWEHPDVEKQVSGQENQ